MPRTSPCVVFPSRSIRVFDPAPGVTEAQAPLTPDPGQNPEQVLADVFGFSGFRGLQGEAVETVMRGEDVLVLMPTGGGKASAIRCQPYAAMAWALLSPP